jgi:hypothetical protein
MPFFAVIEALTGDLLDVVESLGEELPAGAIAVELPAKEDDLRRWLAQHSKDRGGGGAGGEVFLDREEHNEKHTGGRRDEMRESEAFFARLQNEVLRSELEGRHLAVMLFDLSPVDRNMAEEFVLETLRQHGQELLPCDLVARLRDHLVGVVMPDTDTEELRIEPARGSVLALTYPRDRERIDLIRRRRHPLLRRSLHRAS